VSDVKDRMIQRAAVLLAKKGLQGTSFTEVLEASGAPRGSLYHHFPEGKDELVLAAVGYAGGRAMAFLDSLEGKPAADIARAFTGLWRLVLAKSDFGAGCAVVAVTVAAQSPRLLETAASVFRDWRTRLSALFVTGGIPAERAQGLAATMIAACEGAVILARADRSFEPFDTVAAEQIAAIEAAAGKRREGAVASASRRSI